MRYLTEDLKTLERMSISEYELRMTASALKNVDEYERLAQLAIYIRKAQDFNKNTKAYIVQKTSDLVDVKAAEKSVFDEPILKQEVFDRLTKIQQNLEEYHRNKEVSVDGK